MKQTLTYSESDIQQLVRRDLLSKNLRPIGEINISLGTESKGYGQTERDEVVFKGVVVVVEQVPQGNYSSLASQIEGVEREGQGNR